MDNEIFSHFITEKNYLLHNNTVAISKSQGKWIKVQNSGASKKPGKRKGEG